MFERLESRTMTDQELADFFEKVMQRLRAQGFQAATADIADVYQRLLRGIEAQDVTGRAIVLAIKDETTGESAA